MECAPRRRWTLVLLSVAALLENADEALLPAVYNEVAAALGASPTALGSLTLCRALVQAACYPLATYWSARHDRARVVAVGAFLWAVATLFVGASGTFLQMAIWRGLNGIGLALVIPAIYSLVADYTDESTRGSAFGWLQMGRGLGAILGGSLGVLLAPTTFLGIAGWRLAFYIVALVSVILGSLTWLFAVDPRPRSSKTNASATELIQEAKNVVNVPTFQIIVAQGVAGSIPWSAFNFSAMWLELVGFRHWETSVITSLNQLASSLGSLFGGFLGDTVARRFPNTGRAVLAQVSTGSTIPLAAVLLLALPNDPSTLILHTIAFVVLGFVMPWCPSATNNPIFAEIVPEKARTTVYALDRCLESVFASLAPPVVGILAERLFGYKPGASGTGVDTDRKNAAALAKAVYAEIAVPMTICFLIYSFLYCTYPRDRQRAQMGALADCEAGNSTEASVVATTDNTIKQRLLRS